MRTGNFKGPEGVLRYLRDTGAAIAVAFAIMAPVIIGAAGMALDYSRAYLVQQRLAQAIDAAALAAAASSTDPATIEQKVQDFFDANYPPEKLGVTFIPEVRVVGNEVIVTGRAEYLTSFLRVMGIDDINLNVETVVQREVQGIEVALVLDNTGSMSTNNNISKLKEASAAFVNTLFDRTSDPSFIRIGLVPYANAVRVGRYGLGQNPDGTTYGDGSTFVTLPAGVSYTTNHGSSSGWYGCVIEHNPAGWDPNITTNDPYPYDVLDNYEGPWDIYRYETYGCSGSWPNRVCDYSASGAGATNCPYANIMPLSSDRDALLDVIGDPDVSTDGMRAHGNTLGNIGMAWGYRVLSPEFPFEEAHSWDNEYWKKAIIMMTDGENTRDSHYSAFWRSRAHQLNTTDYNERFVETCDALKEKDVIIYTITFTAGVSSSTRQYYEDCATSEDNYYHVSDPDDLLPLFEQIARELSNLHIKS
jgi:Flp pilus assembly protein TadG